MKSIVLKPRARLDFLEIWNHLAGENIEAANRLNLQVDAELQKLREFPGVGHARPDLTRKNVLFWKVSSWIIIYRYDDRVVTILRAVHGSRDLPSLLKGIR